MFSDELNFTAQSEAQNKTFDVIVVGGGVIGLSIARELAKQGLRRVLLIEKPAEKNKGGGLQASRAAAGMLTIQAEADAPDDFFRLCDASRNLYPDFARELFEETGIDIELDCAGTVFPAFDEADWRELEHRFAWQRAADLAVEKLSAAEVLKIEPHLSPQILGALRFSNDWQVENRRLAQALSESVRKNDWCETVFAEASRVSFQGGKVERVEAALDGREFSFYAPTIVLAAGAWTSHIEFLPDLQFQTKIVPVRGQMIGFSTGGKLFRHVVYTSRGYFVPRRDGRILVGATVENAGYDNRTTASGIATLLETSFFVSPEFKNLTISETWSGLRPNTPDDLPILGEFPEKSGLFFAAGHFRNGILLAPLTAKLLAEKIAANIDSPFLQVFNLSRFHR